MSARRESRDHYPQIIHAELDRVNQAGKPPFFLNCPHALDSTRHATLLLITLTALSL